MAESPSTRRQFLQRCARYAGAAGVGAVAAKLVLRADADSVWQLDPNVCTTCVNYTNADGWGRCATECVLKGSAVKAVNDLERCGYCRICPAYFDITSGELPDGTFERKVCPQDAILRRLVGQPDPDDPKNNYYEYLIDESRCNGCGLCVELCKPPRGNASLRLEVRHDLCRDCNQCAIASACPPQAFYRAPLNQRPPGYRRAPGSSQEGPHA